MIRGRLLELVAQQQLCLVVEHLVASQHALTDVPCQRPSRIELFEVVRHPADDGPGSQAVGGSPVGEVRAGVAIAERRQQSAERATTEDHADLDPFLEEGDGDVEEERGASEHVVVCGYGRTGQNLARFLEQEGVPFRGKRVRLDQCRAPKRA